MHRCIYHLLSIYKIQQASRHAEGAVKAIPHTGVIVMDQTLSVSGHVLEDYTVEYELYLANSRGKGGDRVAPERVLVRIK